MWFKHREDTMQMKRLARWYIILVTFVIGFIMYITLTYNNEEQDCYQWDEIQKFNDGWIYTDEFGRLIDVKLPIKGKTVKNTTYIISNTLPATIIEGTSLGFKCDHLLVKVYVDSKECYSFNVDEQSTISKSPGFSYIFVPLSSTMGGKTIRVEYEAVYSGASIHITDFFLGDKSTIITGIIRKNSISILICALIFCLGLIFIVAYLIKRRTYNMSKSILYLGIFSLPFAIWSVTETQTMQFFFQNTYALQYITYLSLALCPVPFLLYYAQQHNLTHSKAVRIIGDLCLLSIAVSLTLQIFGIVDLPDTLLLVHISVVAILGFSIYRFLHDFILNRRKIEQLTLTRLSMIFMLVCTVSDLIRYYISNSRDYSKYIRIGYLMYLGCTGLGTIFRSVQIDKQNKELEQLVYQDAVTGLLNAIAFKKALEALDKNKKIGLVEIEILELDQIADEFGQDAKNQILLSVTKMVERAFHNTGKIYRYTHNKLMIMLCENIDENYSIGMLNLNKRLHNSNKSRAHEISLIDTFLIYDHDFGQEIENVIENLELSLRNEKKLRSESEHRL